MLYTDGTHLVADTLDELHTFAQSIGLRREWYQDHPRHPHYDLTTRRAVCRAQEAGARLVSRREVRHISKKIRSKNEDTAFNEFEKR